jgi:hypothetical protein
MGIKCGTDMGIKCGTRVGITEILFKNTHRTFLSFNINQLRWEQLFKTRNHAGLDLELLHRFSTQPSHVEGHQHQNIFLLFEKVYKILHFLFTHF